MEDKSFTSPDWTALPNSAGEPIVALSGHIGEGTLIGGFALIRERVSIGRFCKIGSYTEICPGAIIEDDVWIHSRCFIVDNAVIGAWAFLGPGVILCDARYPRSPGVKASLAPPTIGPEAIIGAGSIIMPGVVIGARAIIGAGSLVLKDVPEGAVAYGNPCRVRSRTRPTAYLARPPG